MRESQEILNICLLKAGAGDLSCKGQLPPTSSAAGLLSFGGGWLNVAVGILLAGTLVWGL